MAMLDAREEYWILFGVPEDDEIKFRPAPKSLVRVPRVPANLRAAVARYEPVRLKAA